MAYFSPVGFSAEFRLTVVAFIGTLLTLIQPLAANAQSAGWSVLIGGDDANTPREPSGVAVDEQGTIFIVDTAGSRIEKLSAAGRLLTTFGQIGTGNDALRPPRGIALDGRGTLFVADTANHRLQRFAAESGEPLGTWGVIGSAPGEFILPTSLAFDSVGNVYVADTGNHRIQKLGADGQFLAQWSGDLHFPHGVAVDGQDTVYVTDAAGVRKFSSTGELLAEWTARRMFGDPYGVTIGQDETVYVADTDNGRILALSPSGELLARWGREGRAVGQFKYPEALAVDANGVLYVADRGNDRIQVLRS